MKETDRQKETEKKDRQIDRPKDGPHTKRARQSQTDTYRHRQTETKRQKDTERYRQRQTETET